MYKRVLNKMPYCDERIKLYSLAILLFLNGCVMVPGYEGYDELYDRLDPRIFTYKLYPGKRLQENEIAKVNLKNIDFVFIDGLNVAASDYQQVHLLPGKHTMFGEAEYELEVNLLAGHTYELYADRTTGDNGQFYFWILDAGTGEVIGGKELP